MKTLLNRPLNHYLSAAAVLADRPLAAGIVVNNISGRIIMKNVMQRTARLLGAAALLMAWSGNAWAASYGIAQVTFVPMREADIQTSLKNISTAVTGNIQTVIAITATDNGTIIVYDEWEDGYEADIKNPIQSTTKIWGDGDLTNGVAPGTVDDLLNSGKSIVLANPVNPLSPLTIDYDGRDKIGSTKAIAVSRGGWSITPGTVLAGAVNLIDVGNQGKIYTIPVGQNVITASPDSTTNRLFEYTSVHIIASENATTVNIDKDGNGTTDLTVTLNQGETYLVNGGVNAGAKISSDKPVGVYVIAGDVGSTYENRWFAIPATEQWSNSYYAPVGTTLASDPSHVFLYNPSTTSSITVTYDTQTVKGSTISVPANNTVYVPMLTASGAHFYTAGKEKFYAVSTIDSDATANQTHDWSYSLVPESYLTDKFVVAWGPGYDVNGSGAATAVNGSPVWVTAAADTTLNIDYDGNGTVDATYAIKALESYRIFDTDKDQTGLTVWTTDGTLITAAWGEDPSVAGAGNPYLDMGTTVMPFPDYVLRKSSMEASPVTYGAGVSDGDTKMELSEQVEYTVSIINRAVIDLYNINIKDTLSPADSATYVPSSASLKIYSADGVTLLRDVPDLDDTADNFPLGASGYTITDTNPGVVGDQGLKRGEMAVIKYRVAVRSDINQALAESKFVITNTVVMTGDPAGGGDPITKTTVNKTPLTVPFTDGEVYFYKSDFSSAATGYSPTNTLGLQVTDGDQNRDPAVAETVTVTVTNVNTGETEDVVLTETGPNTGIFRNTLATSTNSANNSNNSGMLYMLNGQLVQVEYTDPISGTFADTPAAPGIVPAYTTGNPNIKTVPVAASLPAQTDGLLVIYDSSAYTAIKTSYQEGDALYLQVTDGDQNTDTSKADTVTVVVTNTTTGELETVVLTETGVNTGIFRTSLTTSVSADSTNNSGALHAVMGDALRADYTDGIFGASFDNPTHIGIAVGDDNNIDTGNANSVTGVFAKTKILYLSETGDLDRVDPVNVSPVDNTTATTAAVTPAMSNNISDNFNGTSSGWSGNWTASSGAASFFIDTIDGLTVTGDSNNATLDDRYNYSRMFATPLANAGTVSFNYVHAGTENTDVLRVQYYNGSSWITLTSTETGYSTQIANTNASTTESSVISLSTSIPSGAQGLRFTSWFSTPGNPDNSDFDEYVEIRNLTITSAGAAAVPVTFAQAISMANGFNVPQGAAVKVVTHVSSVTGTPTGASVTAELKYGSTTFATLNNPVYDSAAGTLTWTGNLASAVSIPAGQAVSLVVANGASGTSFKIDYDSATKPSRIELPTTTVINIVDVDNNAGNGIQKIGFYDQSVANGSGSLITSGTINAGGIVYLRVKVLDPFGDYDITSLKLAIDGPGTAGDIGVPTPITLTNANIVNAAGDGAAYKTYEYAWQTVNNTGAYNISVTADEGYEGTITDLASSSFIVTAQDLGTPSTTMFISALGGVDAGPQYTAGADAFLRVTDLDEAGAGTVTAVVNGITVTLTETGPNTGIFEADLAAFNNLSQGTVLVANYVDNDDATDISSDTILVPSVTNLPPVNTVPGTQTVREQVQTPVSGVSVVDPNGNLATTQLTVTGGTLNVDLSSGATISAGANGSGTLTLSGTEAQINAALATLQYTSNNGTIADTVTMVSTDSAGTPLTDTDTFNIVVQDPPVNTVPGTQTVSEQVQTPVSGVSVTDTNGNLTSTQLTVTGGTLNVTASGAATVSGNGTASVTVTGNEADINATLATLQYTSNDGTTADTLTVLSTDGTSLTDTDTFNIVVKNQPVIGSRVWLDENGDGKENPGESGIQNVEVYLYSCGPDNDCAAESDNVLQKTTLTDADGEYLIKDVPPGSYVVRTVQKDGSTTTLPTGLQPTNGIATANTTVITVSGGQEYMTADFGYNWVAPTVTTSPGASDTGAIGDRIWSDANGDGVQDPGEPGLSDVTVKLLTDDNSDGVYGGAGDNPSATTVTDSAGNYIFTNVSTGSYVIAVDSGTLPNSTTWTATGDPDATKDGKTTSPIVLAPGDVYLQGDFGYKPAASGSVTGTIYRDVNADACKLAGTATCSDSGDNLLNGGDTGIPGVTVVLKDASNKIIATTVTDSNGNYTFSGVPTGSNYTVSVTDTRNVLGEVVQSGDPDSTLDNQHLITALSGAVSSVNFGYTPAGQTPGKGMIGSTVFLDRDGDNSFDSGEGLEGVAVGLYKGGVVVAVTQTDENGQYQFGNLPAGSYEVRVTTVSLPHGGVGLTNTVDPDTGSDSKSVVTLTVDGSGAVQPNLTQNFGYVGSNTVSGTIWNDVNADGTKVAAETVGFSGVTVALLDSNGNIVATTTTDASGSYSFASLPDATYTVQVTDAAGKLTGLWLSDGPTDGADDNSQVNGYSVKVGGSNPSNNSTADFGFYKDSTSFGGTLWNDADNDGTLDSGETKLAHYPVVLTITYPNSSGTVTMTTLTDANGNYRFDNVMLDENYNSVAGEPTYTITVPGVEGMVSTHTPTTDGLNDGADPATGAGDNQADDPAGEVVTGLVKGETDTTRDFGFIGGATIGDRVWLDVNRDGIQSLNEPGLSGVTVKIYRDNGDGTFNSGTDTLVATPVVTDSNGNYSFAGLPPGNYWVDVTTPSGLNPATPTQGSDAALDSDKTASVGGSMITVAAGQVIDKLDFGYVGTKPLIGDTVWFDVDNDGIQDAGEAGIGGVTVTITKKSDNSVVATVATDAAGHYLVPVDAGDYIVTVTPPSGMMVSAGGPAGKSITVPANTDILSADFGLKLTSGTGYTIGDLIWEDSNGDKTQNAGETGIAGVTVDLYRDGIPVATTTTNASGAYQFNVAQGSTDYEVLVTDRSGILAGGTSTNQTGGNTFPISNLSGDVTNADFGYQSLSIGDRVWLDVDGDGVQDAGEPGMSGVKVELYLDSDGNGVIDTGEPLIRTETTGSDGLYNFSGLSAGKYVVKLADSNFTSGGALNSSFTVTTANVGDDAKDSDDTGSHAVAATLGASSISGTDFGFKVPTGSGSVSGVVWEDSNKDKSTTGENGIAGVTVALYLDRDGNGKLDSGEQLLGTDMTDGAGAYNFANLPAGKYIVEVSGADKLQGLYMTTGSTVLSFEITVTGNEAITNKNFGFAPVVSTYSVLSSFAAYINDDGQTVLEWKTDSEVGTIGFVLERLNEKSGNYEAISDMLPGMLNPPMGGTYRYVDTAAAPGKEHSYQVREVAVNDEGAVAGPFTVKAEKPLPVNKVMAADKSVAGYSRAEQSSSAKQLRQFAAMTQAEQSLASQQQRKIGNTLKLPVTKDGLVYLTANQIAAASGLKQPQVIQHLKARKCLVTLQGKAVPTLFAANGAALWFYGQAPARNDIGQNIYWLELGKKGSVMAVAPQNVSREELASSGQSFADRTKAEENHIPCHLYVNKPVKDFWSWKYLFAQGKEDATVHSVAALDFTGSGDAAVTVNLVNISSKKSGENMPYKVSLYLNGTSIGGAETAETGDWQISKTVSASLLRESNEVKIVSQLNTGVAYSLIYLDSIEVAYQRKYHAQQGELTFGNADVQTSQVAVNGFSDGSVLALDITDPSKPVRMRNELAGTPSDGYTLTVPTQSGHRYFVTENIRPAADTLTADTPSNLHSPANKADYLIISPLHLLPSAKRLAEYRQGQGLTAMVVDIEDVQDEFSHGLAAPEAVHDFLTYVHAKWAHAPRYVALIGSGSYDYKNYLGKGWPLVPSVLVATPEGFFPSDNALADVDGDDGVPEFAVGRIPVFDKAKLEQYIDKVISYEQSAHSGSKTLIAVSDKTDVAAGNFKASTKQVADLMIPKDMTVTRLAVDDLGYTAVHDQITAAMQKGIGILHYVGHSSLIGFGKSNSLLSANNIDAMNPVGPPMVMVSMSCSAASFGYSPMNSIGESAVLRKDGAAVAFFGATGLSKTYLADIIAEGFYGSLLDPATAPRLGDAVLESKRHYLHVKQGQDVSTLDIYNLLGDPAVRMPALP